MVIGPPPLGNGKFSNRCSVSALTPLTDLVEPIQETDLEGALSDFLEHNRPYFDNVHFLLPIAKLYRLEPE